MPGTADETALRLAKRIVRVWRWLVPPYSRRANAWNWLRQRRARLSHAPSVDPPPPLVFDALPTVGPRARILVLKLDRIGDMIVALRSFLMLRRAWPEAHITLVCAPGNRLLAQRVRCFDEIIGCDFLRPSRIDETRGYAARIALFRSLPLGHYDIAIDLRHDDDATRILLMHVDARYRIGFVSADPKVVLDLALPNLELLSNGTPAPYALHAETRLMQLASLAIHVFTPPDSLAATALLDGAPASRLFARGPIIGIAPGAGRPICEWGTARFAQLMAILGTKLDCRFVLLGDDQDRSAAALLAATRPPGHAINKAGDIPLEELAWLLHGLDLFIGNDTGPTHLAALLGVPTVNIFPGISNIKAWRAAGARTVTISAPTPCAPCHLSDLDDCRHEHACMTGITVDYVAAAALRLLGQDCSPASVRECHASS
jgi:ADP-heptose:LPS heptosyltransferase